MLALFRAGDPHGHVEDFAKTFVDVPAFTNQQIAEFIKSRHIAQIGGNAGRERLDLVRSASAWPMSTRNQWTSVIPVALAIANVVKPTMPSSPSANE